MAAAIAAGAARADDGSKPPVVYKDPTPRADILDTPALKRNILALSFKQPPAGLTVPRVKVEGASGLRDLRFQPGLTLLSLWAPWCAPCLVELRDLAARRRLFEGKRFRMLPVLTGPRGEISLGEARAALAKVGAETMEVTIDRSPGSRVLLETLALRERPGGSGLGGNLPCNLLVDEEGRVLARQFGAPLDLKLEPGQLPTAEMRANARTRWAGAEGEALLGALQRGEVAGAPAPRLVG
ncbi:hypothetical protein [uncultured Caulobacter sp.]|uniref:hypothetical protein n=1 Tax=uncultured Caulobacter sp. TaxID=158749 RepID=UPI002607C222|nr:hypothetical protein [uncultured Caulobacter sp.]